MTTSRITFKSFAVSLLAVAVIEAVFTLYGHHLISEPLVRVGAVRLLEVLFLCRILGFRFPPGISRASLKRVRIAIVICVAMAVAAVLYRFFGMNPPGNISRYFGTAGPFRTDLFIVFCILSPLAEELFFRAMVFRFFRQFSFIAALLISSVLFSSFHTVAGGLPVLPLTGGVLFAVVYDREKTVTSPFLVHAFGNFLLLFVFEA